MSTSHCSDRLRVHAGWAGIHPKTRKYAEPPLTAKLDGGAFTRKLERLSTHQGNILRSRCEGLSMPAIGRRYGISPQTVKNTLNVAFRKLELTDHFGRSCVACYLLGQNDAEERCGRRIRVVQSRRGPYGEAV